MQQNLRYYTTLFAVLPVLFYACSSPAPEEVPAQKEFLFVGTYSVRGSEGIYVFEFQRDSNQFSLIQTASTPESPSFVEFSADGKYLYSANRAGIEPWPENWGSVSAFSVNQDNAQLTLLNQSSSFGNSPCHIHVSPGRDYLYLSHYGGGSFSVLTLDENGSISGLADSVTYAGGSVNPQRQDKPHVHFAAQIPGQPYFLINDLGRDKVLINQMKDGKLTEGPGTEIQSEPGAGPRHLDFLPGTNIMYLAEELTSTVSVHKLDWETGNHVQVQRLSTLPDTFSQSNTVADIHVSPDGRHLYVSNRGHNSLAIFSIDSASGEITPVGYQSSGGEIPRNFMIDAKGEFILVANQNTDNIVMLDRDPSTGLLSPNGVELSVPSPVCLKGLSL